jgi:spore coat protein CotF
MYCTADSCAEACATKTSQTENPKIRRVPKAMLPVRIHV